VADPGDDLDEERAAAAVRAVAAILGWSAAWPQAAICDRTAAAGQVVLR
jgi:hypothetical protein